MDRIVHLSFGDFPGSEYTLQLFADHLIHAWDLARAIGADEHLDDELVASCATWFEAVEEAYRSAGAIAAPPPDSCGSGLTASPVQETRHHIWPATASRN